MRDGAVIDGRYRILSPAGSGGMGNVHEAWDSARNVPVAVKTWRAGADPDERSRARLSREALALAEVHHPAVVQYVDHGVSAEHGPYLVMGWVKGETLAGALQQDGLSPVDALRLTTRLAGGLAALHARGIVHRDVKPANVLLPGGDPKSAVIVDLGIARMAGATAVTSTRGHLGTPRYMAPEQIRNARLVTDKADMFALGCVLFECLTGRPAFEGSSPVSVLARILFEQPPVPSASRSELPQALDHLVERLLHRDPVARPSADEIGVLVERVIGSVGAAQFSLLPVARSTAARDPDPTPPDSTQTVDQVERSAPPSLRIGHNAMSVAAQALPGQSGAFFGRKSERSHLAALLRARTPLTTVWGAPGIGKTRLVVEVVRDLADVEGGWDALVFGDLSEARDADDVVRILSRKAGVSLEGSPVPEMALARTLAKMGRVLLIADPVEHVAASFAAMLLAFRPIAQELQIVAISRERFCPPGAVAVEIGALSTSAGSERLSPAAALLVDRAGHSASRGGSSEPLAEPDAAEVERAERIVEALEGVPLAIELHAAHAPILGLGGLLARITGTVRASGPPTLDMSRGAMRNAITWSWNLLTDEERHALAACAVFRGGFDASAVSAVVAPQGSSTKAIEWLRSLREKSLLYSWTQDDTGELRLSMFPAIREFAWEQLQELPDRDIIFERHTSHYATLYLGGSKAVAAAAVLRLEREADNLLAAAEWASSADGSEVSAGLSCLLALEPAMLSRGATRSFRALLEQALHRARIGGQGSRVPELAARVRQILARLDAPAGARLRAAADLRACLAIAAAAGDQHWQATIHLDLAVVHHLGRELEDARRNYEHALDLLSSVDDRASEGRCLGNLGALSHDEGDLAQGRRLYRGGVALLAEAGEVRQRANFITNLAILEQELGHLETAHELYEESVSLLEPLRDARVLAIALGNLGVLELELGHPEVALPLCERSLALLSGSNDLRSEALAFGRLAMALALVGEVDLAEVRFARGERLAGDDVPLRETISLGRALLDLSHARAALEQGRGDDAATPLRAAEDRMLSARTAADGKPALRDCSDDARATLRIAERLLGELEPSLSRRVP